MSTLFREESFLYPIQSHLTYRFFAGWSLGAQELYVLGKGGLDILRFDAKGMLTNSIRNQCTSLAKSKDKFDEVLSSLVDTRRKSSGMVDAPIHVRRFSLPELKLGLYDYPIHFEEFFEEKNALTANERREMDLSIAEWQSAKQFVLLYGEEYWLNMSGIVQSS
jgi:hypothetical protein